MLCYIMSVRKEGAHLSFINANVVCLMPLKFHMKLIDAQA